MGNPIQINADSKTVSGFGDEWSRFDQSALDDGNRQKMFQDYFSIFPWQALPKNPVGVDVGCGSGRWATLVSPKVGTLHLVDASPDSLLSARKNLAAFSNTDFHCCSVAEMPFKKESLDFAYCLGVLHHVPDTQAALKSIHDILRPGAPILLYLYYAFDDSPFWFRSLWQVTNAMRVLISRLPFRLRYWASQFLAFTLYLPLARAARTLDKHAVLPDNWPLSYYRDKSFYVMRTDALDRFGTRLEKRFTRVQITTLLENAGFEKISFSKNKPNWVAVGYRANSS